MSLLVALNSLHILYVFLLLCTCVDGKGFIAQKQRTESVGTSRETDLEAASTYRDVINSALVAQVCACVGVGGDGW